jgi:HEAT repeat protein
MCSQIKLSVKARSLIGPAIIAIGLATGGTLVYLGVKSSAGRPAIRTLCLQAYAGDTNATQSLKALGHNAVPVLIELTQYRVPAWRKRLPGRLPNLPFSLRPKLVRWLIPTDEIPLRRAAMHALGIIGSDARDAVPGLIRDLDDRDGTFRWVAARAMANIGKAAVPALVTVVQDETNSTRGTAIYALGLIGADAQTAIPTLLRTLTDSNDELRDVTAYTLTRLGPEAVLALIDVAAHGDPEARAGATKALRQLASSPESPIATLRIMAADENPVSRRRALQALGDLRPATAAAVKTLMAVLDDPVLEVRQAAIQALGNIGTKAVLALPELTRLAEDKEESVRLAAKQAIERIGTAAATKPK